MTGTVDENCKAPFVNWDNGERKAVLECDIELIEEQTVKEEIERLKIELNNKQSRIDWLEGNLAAYKDIFRMGVNKHE